MEQKEIDILSLPKDKEPDLGKIREYYLDEDGCLVDQEKESD